MPDALPAALPTLLNETARNRPTAPALSWKNANWSYSDLVRAMDVTAGYLKTRGRSPGDRVALLFRNCPQYVAAYYGVLRAGCVVVPLNPHERDGVLIRQLEHCQARLLIGDTAHPEWRAIAELSHENGVESVGIEADDSTEALSSFLLQLGEAVIATEAGCPADDLATVIYTSGTTGQPKGVMLSHRNLASNAASIVEYLGLEANDRGMAVLPFQFSYGNSVLHTHVAVGAELVLEDSIAYPHAVLQRMVDKKVTGFAGVPSTFTLLLTRCDLSTYDLSRLRYVTQAGGPMPRAQIQQLRAQLSNTRFFVMYGQTEATARLSYLPPDRLDDKMGSVGVAIPGVQLAVLRPDGQVANHGEVGEIVARGPNIMQGYLNDAVGTRETLRDGWLFTGDLGHLDDDGFLYVDGRRVEMIKVGAFRVSPQEVEEVIAAIPGVAEVGVTAVPDNLLGQAIKAVVVLRAGERVDSRAVKAHCRRNLATYKVPKHIEFASALPYTANGKVQRLRLG